VLRGERIAVPTGEAKKPPYMAPGGDIFGVDDGTDGGIVELPLDETSVQHLARLMVVSDIDKVSFSLRQLAK
jgi:hypothetical protein